MATNRFATLESPPHHNGTIEPNANRIKTKAPPSPNGDFRSGFGTTPHPRPLSPEGRGGHGGPGNPFARLTGALRQALLDCTTADDIRQIAKKLLEMAKAGNVPAAKLLLAYTIGKPTAAPNPDQLDLEEWRHFKDTAPLMKEIPQLRGAPAPVLPLECVRTMREASTRSVASMLGVSLTMPETHPALFADFNSLSPDEATAVLRSLAQEKAAAGAKPGSAAAKGEVRKKNAQHANTK